MTSSTPVKVMAGNVLFPSGPEVFWADLTTWESHDK